jgi:hypothetical protein
MLRDDNGLALADRLAQTRAARVLGYKRYLSRRRRRGQSPHVERWMLLVAIFIVIFIAWAVLL